MPTLQGLLGYTPPVTNQLELKKALYAARPEVMQAKTKKQAQGTKDFFNGLLDLNQFVPVTGDVQSGLLAANDVSQGNYGNAALNAIGLLPFVPSMAGTMASKGGKLANALKKTQYEIAHDVAQKNAVEMLGLPPNNTAMDRARAMGFDTDAYHGTKGDFSEFDKKRGATYLTGNPEIANYYALGFHFNPDSANIMPMKVRGRAIEVSDNGGRAEEELAAALGVDLQSGLVNRVGDYGYDYAKINDMYDIGGMQSQLIFPPSSTNIRSRFAAFDPARVNEADLLGYIDPKLLPMLGLLGGAGMGAGYISKKGKE